MLYRYDVHGFFSLTANIPYFESLLHAFRNNDGGDPSNSDFSFILDPTLKISTANKPRINIMLYHDPSDNSIEFYYPWLRPIYAKLGTIDGGKRYAFRFNKSYLRSSQLAGGGWRLQSIYRSLLQLHLIRKRMFILHGGAVKIGDHGVIIPAVENTGKTTTTWMLAKRGAEFLTDEHVIIDGEERSYGIPTSSAITPATARAVGLKLSPRDRIALAFNHFKGKVLTVHLSPGGMEVYPDKLFKICNSIKVNSIAVIQNGTDSVREMTIDETLTKIRTIQAIEFPWRVNPFILAQSFFNPNFDANTLAVQEDQLLTSFVSKVPHLYLVSSSSREHYKAIEKLV